MAINLQKGQKIDIGLTKLTIGLGWDPNEGTGHAFDLDASAFLLNSDRKLSKESHFIFYNNQWLFVNESLHSLKDLTNDVEVPIGKTVELIDGNKLLLSKDPGGRVVTITITNK